jgi:hypothetical protein
MTEDIYQKFYAFVFADEALKPEDMETEEKQNMLLGKKGQAPGKGTTAADFKLLSQKLQEELEEAEKNENEKQLENQVSIEVFDLNSQILSLRYPLCISI